ncbi:MAG: transporter, NhaC family [Firmicutes bacterium]|nr:transporter, NhaC family [Bacillota bacterium]
MKRIPTLFESVLPLIAMFLLLGIGFGVFRLSIVMLLFISALFASLMGMRVGVSWDEMMEEVGIKIGKTMPAIFILVVVGLVIGTWMISGTIPMMIYYGLKIIDPQYMLVTAFFVTAVVSMSTGTSWGSAGTMGVALMGVAAGLNIPLPAAAGAVICGAYIGDKLSPLSDTTVLAPLVAGTTLYEHIRHMLYTTIPGALIAVIVFLVYGQSFHAINGTTPEKVQMILSTLDTIYHFNILLLLPVVIIIAGSIKNKPTIPVMVISSIVASVLAVTIQSFTIQDVFTAGVNGFNVSFVKTAGFNSKMVIPDVMKLLNRGGMTAMMSTALMIFVAFMFAGIISKAGFIDVILNKLKSRIRSDGDLVLTTVLTSVILSIVAGTAYITILLTGDMYKDVYAKRGLDPKNLSRTLEDSGTVVIPLVPWSAGGVFMATTLGVATLEYLPWAILCYTGPLFAILYGYTGFSIAKLRDHTDNASSV